MEWKPSSEEDWCEAALVLASSVDADGTFTVRTSMVYDAGQCLCRVVAGNDNGWGLPSSIAAIDVLPAMTAEQHKQQQQQEAAEARRQEVAETQRMARKRSHELRRLETRELARLSKALAEVDAAGNLSEPLGTLALAELADAMKECKILTVETEAFADASARLHEHGCILAALDSLPQRQRAAFLRKARAHRRSQAAKRGLGNWWKGISATSRRQHKGVAEP